MNKKGKVISIFNNKGGTGKTTSTINIGAVLNQKGYKVLVIDLDSQANLTNCLTNEEDNSIYTMYNAFKDKFIELNQLYSYKEDFYLLKASSDLLELDLLIEKERVKRENKINELIEPIKNQFDFILIDNAPSLSNVVVNSVYASDYFLTPLETDYFSQIGLNEVLKLVSEIQQIKNTQCLGLFFTRMENTSISNHIKEKLDSTFQEDLLKTIIRKNVAIREAQYNGIDVLSYDINCNGSKDYIDLVNEILKKLN